VAIQYKNTAHALLHLLHLRGIRVFLANPGTDLTSLVDAYEERRGSGEPVPKGLLIPHEAPLAAMAYGYFLGRANPCVLFLHASIGPMNALGIVMTAKRRRVPMILISGSMPKSERSRFLPVQWAQDIGDGLPPLKDFLKWSYELGDPQELEAAFDRAFSLAMTDPKGPVCLILPPEVLIAGPIRTAFRTEPLFCLPRTSPDPTKLRQLAEMLKEASLPILITSSLGREPEAVEALVRLSDLASLGVVSFVPEYMNFPIRHPLHLGFSPDRVLRLSDLIIVCDCDVPWIPSRAGPKDTARLVHVGEDPLYSDLKLRGFPSHLAISGPTCKVLSELCEILTAMELNSQKVEERRLFLRSIHEEVFDRHVEVARKTLDHSPLKPAFVSSVLCELLQRDSFLVNEYDNSIAPYLDLPPGHYFCSPHTGYLGWAFGVSLGLKLARPEGEVVATMGDGSYLFSVPSCCHYVSFAFDLPILIVVFNNRGYGAVRRATRLVYRSPGQGIEFSLCNFEKDLAYEKICQAFSGYGERVDRPEVLRPRLERALEILRTEKRQVLMNVVCEE
jgi:acetolactate synthase-1/2/3 large subunit